MRILTALIVVTIATAAYLVAYEPREIATVKHALARAIGFQRPNAGRAVEVARGDTGDFTLHAKINDVAVPMVIDTGATSVVLTYETAKAAGLPLELLDYDVDVETAGGHVHAARLTLDRLAVGRLVERSVPALVVKRGQMKSNLLGMSFLNRLESWEVRADKLMLRGYP
jgi:clan AA aspartic protease (TIGR02281 family)